MTSVRPFAAAAALALAAAGLPLLAATSSEAGVEPFGPTVAWDFNGDGKADLAVGAPGENVGKNTDAGTVSVFMADSSGDYSTASTVFKQGSDGVPGVAEKPKHGSRIGDQFGYSMTSGDYNGDGAADLAIASPGEDVGKTGTDAGNVIVLFGKMNVGLTTVGAQTLKYTSKGKTKGYTYYGDGLASGDMDGDGYDELAVGAPGQNVVRVYKGGAAPFAASQSFGEGKPGVPGKKQRNELFGEALAMGDFDDDGLADLVVGIPYDYDDRGYSSGAVVVVPGSSANVLDFENAQRWSPDSKGIKGKPHPFTYGSDQPDSFGRTLATGEFNGKAGDDLAISAVGAPVKRSSNNKTYQDAGRVYVLFGKHGVGLAGADKTLTQESKGIAGKAGRGDLFGASLAAGHQSAGMDLLAVGTNENSIRVLDGAFGAGSIAISQDKPGVPGKTKKGDGFGSFVRFLDMGSDANQLLAVSSPGESNNSGWLTVLPQKNGLPSGIGSFKLVQGRGPATGVKESGDAWGWLGDSH